ncbi:exo-1,3-beta-glucanase [Pichia californica]|uniref:Glucan 1,3-beta-glucosidase n=1 Tax=Pichia californica TaxID=460514 RepID=A0A9P6WJN5_9ASCO|nr:exo-1,3-beta-glucanase [[Candida] californica]KAG0688380.1 exo-1,3-beta-glucanase [[Candida] californica]
MLSSNILFLLSFLSIVYSFPIKLEKRNSRFNYQDETIYGVNIGGWLVLEPYITPSLFEAFGGDDSTKPVDEYHFCQRYGNELATEILQNHWSNWINEDDFQQMANFGLNFVRIPIGYWAFKTLDNDPYVQGQVDYLDKALDWCKTYGLKAWIDLHGTPGSQNGFDNSGLRDSIDWQSTQSNIDLTLQVLSEISVKYSSSYYSDVVIGIELVNEPLGPSLNMDELIQYYENGYQIIRNNGDVPVIIHDAFYQFNGYWNNILNTEIDPSVWDVILDHHHYQIFSVGELQRSIDDHISYACYTGEVESTEYHNTLCGEWTAALTDCAKWLNGMARGARYDATYLNDEWIGSCNDLYTANYDYFTDPTIKANYRKYVEVQMDAFTHGKMNGWVFWCWKTENLIEWDFKQLVSLDIIPQPLTDRQYYNQCGW